MFLIFCLFFLSCKSLPPPKSDYVKGKGYCVKKYDEGGCNICKLKYRHEVGWGWQCTEAGCLNSPEEKANANKCLEYKTRKELSSLTSS